MENCPICNGRAVGRVGNDQYYCWDCYVEFSNLGNQLKIYDIAEDGTLEELGMADVDASLT